MLYRSKRMVHQWVRPSLQYRRSMNTRRLLQQERLASYITNSVSCKARRLTRHDQGHQPSVHWGLWMTAENVMLHCQLNVNVMTKRID
jgi:hypothetical protein